MIRLHLRRSIEKSGRRFLLSPALMAVAMLLVLWVLVPGREGGLARAQSGEQVVMAMMPEPQFIHVEGQDTPPTLSSNELSRLRSLRTQTHRRGPKTATASTAPKAVAALPAPTTPQSLPSSHLPGDWSVFMNTDFCAGVPACNASLIAEPSVANKGSSVLETYNWYAALSADGGHTFSFVNPQSVLPDNPTYGSFCCDQSVLYDPAHDLFFWLLMSMNDGPSHTNILRLLVANGEAGLASKSFFAYDFVPVPPNYPAGDWFDYPSLGLSNNYLYLSTNLFDSAASFDKTVVFRLPLDALAAHAAAPYPIYYLPNSGAFIYFNATLTQGATSAMYLATHQSTAVLRVYRWPESALAPDAAWNVQHASYPDPVPDGYACPLLGTSVNWCGRSDDRVQSGWISNGLIGFLWDAPKGTGDWGTFAYPYVQSVLIDANTFQLRGEPILYNSSYAFAYPAAGLNARGHIAGPVFYGGGSINPTLALFVWDDLSPNPYPTPPTAPWETYQIVTSTSAPDTTDKWGDFLVSQQNRMSSYSSYAWVGTGFTLIGGAGNANVRPRFLLYGRQRDQLGSLSITPSIIAAYRSSTSAVNPTFSLKLANAGSNAPISWSAAPPVSVTLSATSGSVSSSATISGTIWASSYMTGTYTFGSIAFTATLPGGTPIPASPANVPVRLIVGKLFFFPFIGK